MLGTIWLYCMVWGPLLLEFCFACELFKFSWSVVRFSDNHLNYFVLFIVHLYKLIILFLLNFIYCSLYLCDKTDLKDIILFQSFVHVLLAAILFAINNLIFNTMSVLRMHFSLLALAVIKQNIIGFLYVILNEMANIFFFKHWALNKNNDFILWHLLFYL